MSEIEYEKIMAKKKTLVDSRLSSGKSHVQFIEPLFPLQIKCMTLCPVAAPDLKILTFKFSWPLKKLFSVNPLKISAQSRGPDYIVRALGSSIG